MSVEADRLARPTPPFPGRLHRLHPPELFRAAHDIKGDAATFGFPSAGAAAESLCRIIEHAPDLDEVPSELNRASHQRHSGHRAQRTRLDTVSTASELSRQLRGIADEYLTHANRDRPEHLEAISARARAGGLRDRDRSLRRPRRPETHTPGGVPRRAAPRLRLSSRSSATRRRVPALAGNDAGEWRVRIQRIASSAPVIASGAKQSIVPRKERMIASLRSQ